MERKIIAIFIMMLLVTTTVPVLGHINENNKISGAFIDHNNSEQQIIDTGYTLTNWLESTKLLASDGEEFDFFGVSVSIDGDYALIGARGDDASRGSAYMFKRDGSTWIQEDKLTALDGEADDYFGWSVSIDGDYALIGAQNDDNYKGSAYVFKRDGSTWIQEDKLTASDGEADDLFGRSVSIDGDFALIGAYEDDTGRGSAYVFKRDGSTWIQEDKLTASDGAIYEYFGWSVCIYSDFALIGTYGDDFDRGSAYVFKRDGSTWIQEDKLTASDGESGDGFGFSVSIDGNYAFIGEPWDDGDLGSAFVFKRDGSTWIQEDKLTASDGVIHDWFGWSVSIDSDYALIGAYGDDSERGSVYVFKKDNDIWTQEDKLTASDNESGDSFGWSVSIDGNCALIGVPRDDNEKGAGYIFKKNQPPNQPSINGPNSLKENEEGTFTVSTTDPDDDQVYFYIDWDDENIMDWDGPYNSDQEVIYQHTWTTKNTYTIKVKTKDTFDAESDITEFEIKITNPRTRFTTNQTLLSLFSRFTNLFPILRILLQGLG